MSGTSRKLKRLLAAIMTCMLAASLLTCAVMAADSTPGPVTIDRNGAGSIQITPTYGGQPVSGCTFSVYKVADLDAGATLHYTLTKAFAKAGEAGLDINAVKSSSEVEAAAKTLAGYISNAKDAVLTPKTDGKLELAGNFGIFLVVQNSAPYPYTTANPILVYVPYYDTKNPTHGWQMNMTAEPKLGMYSGPSETSVSVNKVWDDAGNEKYRPASVTMELMRNGASYATAVLNAANGWKTSWSSLSTAYTWTVEEANVPDSYSAFADHSGSAWTITNTYEDVPLADPITVSKVWNDSSNSAGVRPSSVTVTLYKDGAAYTTAELNAANGWSASWAGLSSKSKWTLSENNVPAGYKSSVTDNNYAFTVTNTYSGTGTDIGENPVPGSGAAPQTGMLLWPIPLLMLAGAAFFAAADVENRKNKKNEI